MKKGENVVMKIIIDLRTLHKTGIYRYGLSMLKALKSLDFFQKHDVKIVIKSWDDYEKYPWFRELGKYVVIISDDFRYIRCSKTLQELCVFWKADVYYSMNYLIDLELPIKKIVTIHDLIGVTNSQFQYTDVEFIEKFGENEYELIKKEMITKKKNFTERRNLIYNYLKNYFFNAGKAVEYVVTVSETSKKNIIKNLGIDAEKVRVTYNGVDDKVFNRRWKTQENQIKNIKYLLYVGAKKKHKRFDFLIRALGMIGSTASFELVVVGKKDEFEYTYHDLIQKNELANRIKFVSEIDDYELAKLYINACALVVTSQEEGFCLPILEALKCGTTVIAPDIEVFKELYKNTIEYYTFDNYKQLANLVVKVLNNEVEKNDEEIDMVIKEYDWNICAQKLLEIFELLEQKERR